MLSATLLAMTVEELEASVAGAEPPAGIGALVEALWWDARGDWSRAHQIAQDVNTAEGAWVHGYLHRKEGDEANAGYWYGQAGRPHARGPLEAEWRAIAEELLRD
jgi:hypothetical protein